MEIKLFSDIYTVADIKRYYNVKGPLWWCIFARNAWQKLGNMPQEEAMHNYIGVLTLINPAWHKNYKQVQ